jgi:endonuclease-3
VHIGSVLSAIRRQVGPVDTASRDPFAQLVGTMISLRTKDEVTAEAAGRLLQEAPTPERLSRLTQRQVERLIFPAGFYRNKARALGQMARMLIERHDGRVPDSMEALLALPGVGRKTANLVLARGFGIEAICVDTHVHRVSNRLGYVRTSTPDQTEQVLRDKLPRRHWLEINGLLVRFGQQVCTPLSPWCSRCPVVQNCARVGVERSR